MVFVAMPVLSLAQTMQVKPSPQQRSTVPAPATSAPGTQPVSAPAIARQNNIAPAPPRPVVPQAVNPSTVTAASELRTQAALSQPALIPSSAPAGHEASAAVDYSSGQLTVVADKAPLGHVLKLIAGKTGAVIDLAPELQQEPVMARLGPGSVREVLTGLLDSPHIDYIVFGSGDEPGSLQRIVVRKRQSFGSVAMGAVRSPQSMLEGAQQEPDPNGRVISKRAIPGQAETQEQRMEEWKKTRAQMVEAEIKQQAQDRENEKYQAPEQPAPQETPQQQENPPQL